MDEMVIPENEINKRAKLEEERAKAEKEESAQKNLRLTKHFRELKQFPPMYTGGAFKVLQDE